MSPEYEKEMGESLDKIKEHPKKLLTWSFFYFSVFVFVWFLFFTPLFVSKHRFTNMNTTIIE